MKVAIADVQEERLNQLGKELVGLIGEAHVLVVPTDVAQVDQVVRLRDRVYETWGEVRIVASGPRPCYRLSSAITLDS